MKKLIISGILGFSLLGSIQAQQTSQALAIQGVNTLINTLTIVKAGLETGTADKKALGCLLARELLVGKGNLFDTLKGFNISGLSENDLKRAKNIARGAWGLLEGEIGCPGAE